MALTSTNDVRATSSAAREVDRLNTSSTPEQDDTPYIRFALDQLTRGENVQHRSHGAQLSENARQQTIIIRHPQPVFLSARAGRSSRSALRSTTDSRLQDTTAPGSAVSTPSSLSIFSTTEATSTAPSLSFGSSTNTFDSEDLENGTIKIKPLPSLSDDEGCTNFEDKIATKEDLEKLTAAHSLPYLPEGTWTARLRQFRHGTMSMYRRLYTGTIIINIAVIAAMIAKSVQRPGSFTYESAATATGANLVIGALMRHEHWVNLLFKLVLLLPYSTPMAIRRNAAKVAYSYGGIHSGCGISALLWYVFYTTLVVSQFRGSPGEEIALATVTAATLFCLCIIIGLAHPTPRSKYHDVWEISHRFAGWTAIGLVWAQTLLVIISAAHHARASTGLTLVRNPTFWFLAVITGLLIYPWLRMRHRKVTSEVLSSHAVRLHFNDAKLQSCRGYRLATNPLLECHGFATIPDPVYTDVEAGKGYSILISRAGDWTGNLIKNPPTKIWSRGAPTTGVLRIASLFTPIVVVATGSGIGPCLSFLQCYPHYPMRVLWSARHPQKTYGSSIMNAVLRADGDAVVIDTEKTKKPDMTALSYALAKKVGAEAIIIISNPWSTRKVVYELEARGVPAFGAIFDS